MSVQSPAPHATIQPVLIDVPFVSEGRFELNHLGMIEASGEQAAQFLQNMLSQDVLMQPDRSVRLASLCSPKGRMQASGWVVKLAPDRLIWIIARDLVEVTLKRLKMFQLRMKLTLKDLSRDFGLIGEISASEDPEVRDGNAFLKAELGLGGTFSAQLPSVLGRRRLIRSHPLSLPSPGEESTHASPDPTAWHLADVLSGIAQVKTATAEAFVPQMLNHESVDGVNFKKGCYPGQEVVARSQFRGAIKRRAAILFARGAEIKAGVGLSQRGADGDDEVGMTAQTALTDSGTWLIASVQTAALLSAEPIYVDGHALVLLPLPYQLRDDI